VRTSNLEEEQQSYILERSLTTAKFKAIAGWIALFGLLVFGIVFLAATVYAILYYHWMQDMSRDHFQALVCLPFIGVAAFSLISVLEMQHGTVEMRGSGFEFKGAAGPAILWIFTFLAMAAALKMLW